MRTLITGGIIVNEGRQGRGILVINGEEIEVVGEGTHVPAGAYDKVIDAEGQYVLPGVIDTHVHFREPGLTQKGDISTESRAAAYGGVTTFMDMPNTIPPTVSLPALDDKRRRAAQTSSVNYAFFAGATATNDAFLRQVATETIPGIKLFLGATTGAMAVDDEAALERIFALAHERGLIVMAHCEDNAIISRNMQHYKALTASDDPAMRYHPLIRSREACRAATQRAVALAQRYGAALHIAHVSTAEELALLGGTVTGEACLSYLLFTDDDYATLGARIKCNPAIKTAADRRALRDALREGRLTTVATDHAPHLLSEKEGAAAHAAAGMPMVQFFLPAFLTLCDEESIPLPRAVALLSHNPATLFGVAARGFLRPGYRADVVIVAPQRWTVRASAVQSRCGWSPLEGRELTWTVRHTICNGRHIYADGTFDSSARGEEITFIR